MTTRIPAVFVAHGSPMVGLEDDAYTRSVEGLGDGLPEPRAIVVVSAHWEAAGPVRVTSNDKPQIIYDFGGFPAPLYQLEYPCPGSAELAREIVGLAQGSGLSAVEDERRGLDHGVWIPLRRAYPAADIPVVQVSLPRPRNPELLLRLGAALAPMREQGVLLIGSGGLVHNLGLVHFEEKAAPVDGWARDFDDWIGGRLAEMDIGAIAAYRYGAPRADLAVPTSEHYDPVFFTLGAAVEGERAVSFFEGFHHGNLSMRSFLLTP